MDKVYQLLLNIIFSLAGVCSVFGQNSITVTDRTDVGMVSFSPLSKLSNINDNNHVDGYVKKYGDGRFIFPIGQNGSYRPFAAEADGISGAYFKRNAGEPSENGAAYPLTSKESTLTTVSSKEYWDIKGARATKLTLTWNSASGVGVLAANSLPSLAIAGWNSASARWERIPVTIDEISIFGTVSSLESGSITSVAAIVPDNYKVFTLAGSNVVSTPSSYAGTLEVASCTEVNGWVWDKNYPNSTVTVELIEGGTVLATTVANQFRQDLKNQAIGTGNYGFSMKLPVSYMGDGIAHQISVRVRNSSYLLGGSPKAVSCLYEGAFAQINCDNFDGWAWNKNNQSQPQTVELVEGNVVVATELANKYREDIKNAGIGNGYYGFSGVTPDALRDGRDHYFSVRIKENGYILSGANKLLKCPVNNYLGNFEYLTCTTVSGWVYNKNYIGSALTVELFEGNTVYATSVANIYRDFLKTGGYGTGYYGFNFTLPPSLKDGKAHQLSVRVKGSSYILVNSPRALTCAVNDYGGNFEAVDCNTFSGWVWDRNNPNAAVTVELFEGTTVYATTEANIYREALKTAGYGTGNYVFRLAIPPSLKDGKVHQLSVRVKGSTYVLPNSAKPLTCDVNLYSGNFEYADCKIFSGWVWDKNNPDAALTVELFEGATVYATGVANIYRDFLKAGGYGTGNYGFSFAIPPTLKDGKAHQLSVRVKGTTYALVNSPRTLTCAVNDFGGNFEVIDCNTFSGWVWDKNNPGAALTVELFEGTTVYATTEANIYREALKTGGYGTGNYVFRLAIPPSLKDGKAHQLSVRVKGSTYVLPNSAKPLTCAANVYSGNFEYADCKIFSGWVWDKNNPDAALTVELFEGTTVYATGVANIYRDFLKAGGYGTGNYGFSFAIPPTLKDGKAHQLSVRVKGTTYALINSPRTLNCAVNDFGGNFEAMDCNTFSGWVWDKNNPGAAFTVELFEGTTVYATAEANMYREALKVGGYGTGNYVFRFDVPTTLKDGKAHQLSVRVKGSNYVLGGSPKALTCATNIYSGNFEYIDCKMVSGWIWDKNNPAAALTVELYEGTTVYATSVANIYRDFMKAGGYGTGYYGFSFALPAALKDGKAHQLSVRVKGSTYVLANSPKALTCVVNDYSGNFEYIDCNQLNGWIWDRNNPGSAVTVELYEGTTVYATAVANVYRDFLKAGGYGTGYYGFSLATPVALKDGKPHQVSVRVKGTSMVLTNSPRTLTCAAVARLSATVEELAVLETPKETVLSEDLDLSLRASPNPTRDKILVEFVVPLYDKAELTVINISGDVISAESVPGKGERITRLIDLESYMPGIYVVSVKLRGQVKSKRVLLVK